MLNLMRKTATIIPASHQNEWESKRKFEEAIRPWYLPFGWTQKDYGIDGQIEITDDIDEERIIQPQSQYYQVQLKSIENPTFSKGFISYSTEVHKIIQWFRSNIPVQLVLFDLKTGLFYYQWIDDALINLLDSTNPKWPTQVTITIRIPLSNCISTKTKGTIKDYVYNWKRPSRKIIQPGLYFDLVEKSKNLNQLFASIAAPFSFKSIGEQITEFDHRVNSAIYRITITGPGRSGKSTLINALLRKKEVSPTGLFQTTGVPIQILPGTEESVQITFVDGKTTNHKFSKATIKKFASQEENIGNEKKVALVTIFTQNTNLEKGISLFDIPGLDDYDDAVFDQAWLIIQKSNAIIYMIDASSAQHGGFAFRSDYKKHIQTLSSKLDKIFLVVNKINSLSQDKFLLLKKKVNDDLKRLELFDKIADKIHFISAEESLEKRVKGRNSKDNLDDLENEIWQYLLKENRIGLGRLSLLLKFMQESIRDFSGLLQSRQLDIGTKRKLVSALVETERKIPGLVKIFHTECRSIQNQILGHVEIQKNRILNSLEKQLTAIPQQNDLPGKQAIKTYLFNGVNSTLESTNQLYIQCGAALQKTVNMWIENNFQEIWDIIAGGQEQRNLDINEFEAIEVPDIDVSNSLGVGVLTWLVTTALAPAYSITIGLASFLSNLFLTMEERRAKRIKKLMDAVRTKTDEIYARMGKGYTDAFSELSEQMRNSLNKNIKLYLTDLKNQVSQIDIAITPDEEDKINKSIIASEELRNKITQLNDEIISWYS